MRYGEQPISKGEFSFICLFFSISDICVSRLQEFFGSGMLYEELGVIMRVVAKNNMSAALSGFVLVVCSGVPLAADAVELVAHEATYNMSLLSVDQD